MVQFSQKVCVEAPGSLVMMGEHAVLHGYSALAFTINKGISIFLTPRNDRIVKINSSLGHYKGNIDLPMYHPSFSFIIKAIDHIKPPHGFNLDISSQIDHKSGLGSSSAITVAITAALLSIKHQKEPLKKDILKASHEIILKVQGKASGIDIATAIYGGLILYSMPNYSIKHIDATLPIHLIYSGYKTATSKVLEIISNREIEFPSIKLINKKIYSLMGELSNISAEAISAGNLKLLANSMNMQQGLLETLGVSDKKLSDIVWSLREQPKIMAAKISGSGLGDCVIALGKVDSHYLPYQSIDCKMNKKGIKILFSH
ncbi:mevalonate kinase [Candidatus Liberibacter americanus]|uniref:GHMP kinase n=1 Tax=Candidatus Liberibacter americanus str. Sao Paulo TaxID=1261131 RepID=U6B8K7_9HYPH|nr:mevalonate kinase [Candidatus Liberibacter americanus]AHA28072.1 GHMP kinase [Candidatus Liberibacter americanus str. Sao Paulo]EMS35959.1 GHMP kinase [Candidatus Liberibacter americanus PW_SP]